MCVKSLRSLLSTIYHKTWCAFIYNYKLLRYRGILSSKVKRMRQKDTITVLFVVSEAASWKTESLYVSMMRHPRFKPVLGISTSRVPAGSKQPLIGYLKEKKYQYIDLDTEVGSINKICPDIIFYYKPYSLNYTEGHFFKNNLNYIFCGVDYCFETEKSAAHIDKEYFDYCWQFYVENDEMLKSRFDILGYRANNTIVTGVPMQDILLSSKELFEDQWKDKTGKKRIIYAPHHSFKGTNGDGIEYATFLDFGEPMLYFAKKYCDEITIAFKPHPNLYMKLLKIWGREKTDDYYNEWKKMENTQIETGEYVGLFKYSDAIIHDCASFIVEYLYMNKPGLYLVAESNNMNDMFDFVKDGYLCYEHGRNIGEIECFINSVINGEDNKMQQRGTYIQERLLPPNGKTASENIINAILGNNNAIDYQ